MDFFLPWLIFAIVAIFKCMDYTSKTFWRSIPSADPRFVHSVDNFVDGKEFNALPTFSK